jgi:hypothetical protein
VTATSAAGTGLISRPAFVSVVHDDRPPAVQILEPSGAVYVSGAFPALAEAVDEGSGIRTLQIMFDDELQDGMSGALPPDPVVATATIDSGRFADGPHSLSAVAIDHAGNSSSVARLVIVDRGAPETTVVTGPSAETADRTAVFTLGGSDDQSPDLEFTWRLDAGAWSPFSAESTVRLDLLSVGSHRFEAAARDRAGNVDLSPATRVFAVTAPRIRVTSPVPEAVITTTTLWLRGTLESGEDMALRVSLPASLQSTLSIEALPVPVEAGSFALEIPVAPDTTELVVIGRTNAGAEVAESIPISVQSPLSPALRLDVSPAAGLAPHAVRFSDRGYAAGSSYSLDLESDGVADFTGATLGAMEFVYPTPGIYLATLRVTSPEGAEQVVRGAVEVYDRVRLESRLRVEWSAFKDALNAGDIDAAAAFIHGDRRAAWSEYLGRLTPSQLASAESTFRDITLVDVSPGRVDFEMMREEDGLFFSFPVSFEIDNDGRWRLWQF